MYISFIHSLSQLIINFKANLIDFFQKINLTLFAVNNGCKNFSAIYFLLFKNIRLNQIVQIFMLVCCISFFISNDAFAAGDITAGIESLKALIKWMKSMGIGLVTLAFMFIGYKMIFGGAQWKEVAPIFWGAIMVAGAAFIAASLAPELAIVDSVTK